MDGHDTVVHLASNPDIAAAVTNPAIDFDQGTALTNNVVEAMRTTSAQRLLYASGSGVYGDLGHTEAHEDHGPLLPGSTYGASKLAGEALICSYVAMFDLTACAFRFGNVVGPRQTHGVGFDFVRRLRKDPTVLSILGDGSQSKSYIDVGDVVSAVLTAHQRERRALPGLQRRHRRLHHGDRDRPPGPGGPGPRPRRGHVRVHGRRPGVEGRRADRAPRHRPHPGPGVDAHRGPRPRPWPTPWAPWPATTLRGCSERRAPAGAGLPRP